MTVEAARKLVPVRVTVVSGLPAAAEDGLTEDSVGTGFDCDVWVVELLFEPQPARDKATKGKEKANRKRPIISVIVTHM